MSSPGLFIEDGSESTSVKDNQSPRSIPAPTDSRRLRSAERRVELLQVATRLFHEKGYAHTTLQDIADRMQFTKAAIYYYARNKEELLLEIYVQIVEPAIVRAHELAGDPSEMSGASRFIAMIREHLTTFLANLEANAVFDVQRISLSTQTKVKMQSLDREYHHILCDVYASGIADGSLQAGIPTVRVNAILGMCNMAHRWYRPGRGLERNQVIEEILSVIENGVRVHA